MNELDATIEQEKNPFKKLDLQLEKVDALINEVGKCIDRRDNFAYQSIFNGYQRLLKDLESSGVLIYNTMLVDREMLDSIHNKDSGIGGETFYEMTITSLNCLKPIIKDCFCDEEGIKIKAHFDEIEEIVISEFNKAKFTIWAAVAWTSNPKIIEILEKKHKEGLNIQLIMSKEYYSKNKATFDQLGKSGIEVYMVNKWGWDDCNRMHDKFSVIDLKMVISGSYNYTETAENNIENITIIQEPNAVKGFLEEFKRIKTVHGVKS